jgi:hypothetical protein
MRDLEHRTGSTRAPNFDIVEAPRKNGMYPVTIREYTA